MTTPVNTARQVLEESRAKALLESGLSRIKHHLEDGKDLAVFSSATDDDATRQRHVNMINRIRTLGYGPIVATGKTKEWKPEHSVIVPNMTLGHAKQVGDEFGQQAIVHYRGKEKKASLYYLKAAAEGKAGTTQELGGAKFNTPNDEGGVTAVKGAGYSLADKRNPSRSFTFKEMMEVFGGEGFIVESLQRPPRGMFAPDWKPYIEE